MVAVRPNLSNVSNISLAVDRNAAESQFATRTAIALVSRDQNLATADKTHAIALADAIRDQSQSNTQSTFDLATNLAAPARTYTRAIAQADRDHAVDVAEAKHDFADHQNAGTRDSAIDTAADQQTTAKEDAKSAWKTEDDQEQIDRFSDELLAAKTRTIALIAADVAQSTARVNQQRAFDNENSAAYLQTMTAWENIDAVYRQYEANSFASSAANLASYNGSPWADYDADQSSAIAANVTASRNGRRTSNIAKADAQSIAEIAQTNASGDWEISQLTSRGTLAAAMANVNYAIALAESITISADDDEMRVPTVPLASELDGLYEVAKPGIDYATTIYSASNNTFAHYYSGYWWGAWGYYGSGYWYSSYYGYGYPYQSYFSSANHVGLSQPSEQFPDSFWKVHDEVDG